jgi:hypothetical protein
MQELQKTLTKYKKYIIWGLVALLIITLLKPLMSRLLEYLRTLIPLENEVTVTGQVNKDVYAYVRQIYESWNFGSWYNPASWYESEATVIRILNDNIHLADQIKAVYYAQYGVELYQHCMDYMRQDQFSQIVIFRV